jgi:hypothetical protein
VRRRSELGRLLAAAASAGPGLGNGAEERPRWRGARDTNGAQWHEVRILPAGDGRERRGDQRAQSGAAPGILARAAMGAPASTWVP